MVFELTDKRIYVAGHRGMVGQAVVRRLGLEACHILTAPRSELDLLDQRAVQSWMRANKPDAIILAAAKVGGISANDTLPVDFLHENLMIEANVLHAAHLAGVKRLLFLGSSCIYPRLAPQPIREEVLLTGPLEPTNEWYAVAKIAGIKLCQAYRKQHGHDWISAMPTNLFGPGDNYDLATSHVLPALLRKIHQAQVTGSRTVDVWGSGTALREFLHCDDLADALVFLLRHYSGATHINVGSGTEISIRGLAEMILRVVRYDTELIFDSSKPDGTPRKLLDCARLHALGWNNARPLEEGIRDAFSHFVTALAVEEG